MLNIKNLSKTFGANLAVDKVSFDLKAGEKLVLLGTSGSGKTTTLKMINRLVEPSEGEIFLNGRNILDEKPTVLRRSIGYVIQNTGLFPHYTVAQNIAIVPKLLKWDKSKTRQRSQELLDMLGLPAEEFMDRYPKELSGGQRQRIGIARALATDPPLMLLDEPFGALDPITRSQIHKEFHHLESLRQKTMLMVSHDVFEAVELGTMVGLMDKGVLQQIGTPQSLIFRPKNAFVSEFFQSQRFQLELKILCIKDILSFLEFKDTESNQKLLNFAEDKDLLSIMEDIAQKDQTEVLLLDREGKKIGHTDQAKILTAFYRFKKNEK